MTTCRNFGSRPSSALLGVAVILIALAVTTPALAADLEVKIENFTFNPQKITVKAGTTVNWTNVDDIPHTVEATTKAFKSKALDKSDKFSFMFTTPGSYEYFCSLHPHMKASIVVEAASGQS